MNIEHSAYTVLNIYDEIEYTQKNLTDEELVNYANEEITDFNAVACDDALLQKSVKKVSQAIQALQNMGFVAYIPVDYETEELNKLYFSNAIKHNQTWEVSCICKEYKEPKIQLQIKPLIQYEDTTIVQVDNGKRTERIEVPTDFTCYMESLLEVVVCTFLEVNYKQAKITRLVM